MSDGHGIYTLTTDSTSEPITRANFKTHARIDATDDDTLIDQYIPAARTELERELDIAFFTQTWTLNLDEFPSGDGSILVNKTPLQSVTSIAYVDVDGNSQTLAASVYTVDTDHYPGRIYLAHNQSWPNIRTQRKAITVTFVAGFSTVGAIPAHWKQVMYLAVGDFYENRESGLNVAFTYKENPTFKRLANSIRMRPYAGAV